MTVIKTGGTHLGLSNWVQEIITGVIISRGAWRSTGCGTGRRSGPRN